MSAGIDSAACAGTMRTVFELPASSFVAWREAAPYLLIVALWAALAVLFWRKRRNAKSLAMAAVSLFCLLFSLLVATLAVSGSLSEYHTLNQAVQSDWVTEVEGRVTKFTPSDPGDHTWESFSIGGKVYSYSYSTSTVAYHRTEPHGGYVHAGEYVRIHSVDGKIVLLAICTDDTPRFGVR